MPTEQLNEFNTQKSRSARIAIQGIILYGGIDITGVSECCVHPLITQYEEGICEYFDEGQKVPNAVQHWSIEDWHHPAERVQDSIHIPEVMILDSIGVSEDAIDFNAISGNVNVEYFRTMTSKE